jgi:hypothetical protein
LIIAKFHLCGWSHAITLLAARLVALSAESRHETKRNLNATLSVAICHRMKRRRLGRETNCGQRQLWIVHARISQAAAAIKNFGN